MVTSDTFLKIAFSLPGTEQNPHFDRVAFKVTGRRIFASLLEESNSANIKLSLEEQKVFCEYDASAIYPVPNKFGLQGWTTFDLSKVSQELVSEALLSAYNDVLADKKKKAKG